MKSKELYEEVLAVVEEVTDIPRSVILSSNREECVDARFLLVYSLSRMLTDSEIARLTGRTRRGIAYLRTSNHKLHKWLVGKNWEDIKKRLGNDLFLRN